MEHVDTSPGNKPGWYSPSKAFLPQTGIDSTMIFHPDWGKGGKGEWKIQMKPILPPVFFLFCPTCARMGPLPFQCTIPAPWFPLHHSCHNPDPISALNCPRPHTTQAPSQSTSKGRLHKGSLPGFQESHFYKTKWWWCQHLPTAISLCEKQTAVQVLLKGRFLSRLSVPCILSPLGYS